MTVKDPDYDFKMHPSTLIQKTYSTRSSSSPESTSDIQKLITLGKQDYYDFKVLCHYNFCRGLECIDCYKELSLVFGSLLPEPDTIQRWYKSLSEGKEIREMNLRGGKPPLSDLETTIKNIIDQDPYISLRRLERILGHSKKALKKIVEEKLNMRKLSTRWVPHILTPEQMQARVDAAELMKKKLLQCKKMGFKNIVTGDESWFYLSYPPFSK
jgi:hypothetical protein